MSLVPYPIHDFLFGIVGGNFVYVNCCVVEYYDFEMYCSLDSYLYISVV